MHEMCTLVDSNTQVSLQDDDRGLMNVFTGIVVTAEQTKDMLSFRQVGIQAYKQYISTRILQSPSHANTTLRCNQLLTMGTYLVTHNFTCEKVLFIKFKGLGSVTACFYLYV